MPGGLSRPSRCPKDHSCYASQASGRQHGALMLANMFRRFVRPQVGSGVLQVFIAYEERDVKHARNCEKELRSRGINTVMWDPEKPWPDPYETVSSAVQESDLVLMLATSPRVSD